MTKSFSKPALSKNNSRKLASSKNNNSILSFGRNDGDSKINRFGICGDSVKYTKKSG